MIIMHLSHEKKGDWTFLSPYHLCMILHLTENQMWLQLLSTSAGYMASCPLRNCGTVLSLWTLMPCNTSEPRSRATALSERDSACQMWQRQIRKPHNGRDDTRFAAAPAKI